MTETDQAAQITGISIVDGHVGYWREASRVLVPEAFDGRGEPVAICAAFLRQRLPATFAAADMISRETDAHIIYSAFRSYHRFVELCEKMEAQTGKPCRIVASC